MVSGDVRILSSLPLPKTNILTMLDIKYDYRLRPIKQDLPDMREGDAATRGLDAYGRPLRCTSETFRYTDPNSAYSSLTIDEILDPEMHRLLARWLGGLEPSEIGKYHDSIVLCINVSTTTELSSIAHILISVGIVARVCG
jgi:hypothetical protein